MRTPFFAVVALAGFAATAPAQTGASTPDRRGEPAPLESADRTTTTRPPNGESKPPEAPGREAAPLPQEPEPLAREAATSVWRPALIVSDEGSLLTGLPPQAAATVNIALIQPSLAWRRGDRARAVANLSGIVLSQNHETTSRLRVREAYAGFTAGDFDLGLGKKVLRWSNGYAFAPAGVLDPPRRPTDPTDRLGLHEGRGLALSSFVGGRHSLTVAWASAGLVEQSRPGLREVTALRYNALVRGLDTSLILAYRRGLGPFVAWTFTAVAGSALELHGDLAFAAGSEVVDGSAPLRLADDRRISALLGAKVSLPWRVSAIFELHSADGAVRLPSTGPFSGTELVPTQRRHHAFLHIGKGRLRDLPRWRDWDIGVALLLGLSDRGRMLIVDLEHRMGQRFAVHTRASLPGGPSGRSEYGMIPWASQLSIGLRFQI